MVRNRLKDVRKANEGFSFIELVIVVAVIGILTAIAIPSYGGIQASAKQAAVDSNAKNAYRAALAADISANGDTPEQAVERLQEQDGSMEYELSRSLSGDYCVQVSNTVDLDSSGEPRYKADAGSCATVPTNPGGGTGGSGDGEETPGDGSGTTNPGDNAARASFTLQCPVDTNWRPMLDNFTGEQFWSDDVQLGSYEERLLEAGETYTVELSGTYTSPTAVTPESAPKLVETGPCLKRVNSWGSESNVSSLSYGLVVANGLEYVASPPKSVKSIENAFYLNSGFNGSLAHWDTSGITNMEGAFYFASNFDQPLNSWDVSNVTNMKNLFFGAEKFDQPLDSWVTSNVTNMANTFQQAMIFDQDINGWDVSNVTDFSGTFTNARKFDQPLDNWKTGKATTMLGMFSGAHVFDSDINDWDVSKVTDMDSMFQGAWQFNKPLNKWNTGNVTSMFGMFNATYLFDQDLSMWDVSNVNYTGYFAESGTPIANQPNKLPKFNS